MRLWQINHRAEAEQIARAFGMTVTSMNGRIAFIDAETGKTVLWWDGWKWETATNEIGACGDVETVVRMAHDVKNGIQNMVVKNGRNR